jgi:hypothetical protein
MINKRSPKGRRKIEKKRSQKGQKQMRKVAEKLGKEVKDREKIDEKP